MSVIEGTTDPKPAAGFTNPDTALTDPSTRIVGILEEVNGAYTYYFATDVTTPLLMADAVDQRNVSLGKVANNGHLAVKDGMTLHRVALQLCYVDPVSHADREGESLHGLHPRRQWQGRDPSRIARAMRLRRARSWTAHPATNVTSTSPGTAATGSIRNTA